MTTEVRVPTLGESVSEATIGQWFKKAGEHVNRDEPLVELETDKVTVEVPSPIAGTLTEILAKNGETVAVNSLLAYVSAVTAGGPSADAAEVAPIKNAANNAPSSAANNAAASPSKAAAARPASPAAAKAMVENNVAPNAVTGSGRGGQVLKSDVVAFMANQAQQAQQPAAKPANNGANIAPSIAPMIYNAEEREERVRMTKLRQTIATRLKDAQNVAAMLTTFNEVDMTAIMNLRKKYKDVFEKKHNVRLGFMGFFTKAVCQALKEIPAINAQIDGQDIIYKNYVHAGIAVGTDKGLVVPVVRHADRLSIADIEKEISRLGGLAREGKLSVNDMRGGTFTITNGGVYGSMMSTPILNAPQSGILGMHAIKERPVVIGGQITVRPMMYIALTYDHRIVDGQEAVTFLVRVKESLEDPERFVIEV